MATSEDQSDYIEQVVDRCQKLIRAGIWDGIQESRLDGWLGCLRNCNSELLGAYLLDNLAYRTRDQYASLLDTVFHNLTFANAGHSLEFLKNSTGNSGEKKVCLAPVIGHTAPPTKSGPYILRLAQRRYRLHNDWLVWPQALGRMTGLSDIFFVDDFCGTGDQFIKFLAEIDIQKILKANPGVRITYLVTAIHVDGLAQVQKLHPCVHVIWGERLRSINSVLSPEAFERYRVPGFAELIAEQYQAAVKHTGLPTKGRIADGFGSLGLAYGFAHATPNNTLPIFWMSTPKLTALLDR
jgi:hypothetical protein